MSRKTAFGPLFLAAAMMAWPACDDAPTGNSKLASKFAPSASRGKARPRRAPPPKRAEPERKSPEPVQLSEEDFVASVESNRDPFRSYLAELATPMRRTVRVQRKVLMPRFGLDELRLIAVVTGRVRPRAMFRDPTGLGISVKRGDYISKSQGRIKQILPGKVVVEIEETSESEQRMADRVIPLHPSAAD